MSIAYLYGAFGKEENSIISRQGQWHIRLFAHILPHNYIPLFSAQLTQLYVANLMIASLELLRSCSMEQHIILLFPYKAKTWAPSGKEF